MNSRKLTIENLNYATVSNVTAWKKRPGKQNAKASKQGGNHNTPLSLDLKVFRNILNLHPTKDEESYDADKNLTRNAKLGRFIQ